MAALILGLLAIIVAITAASIGVRDLAYGWVAAASPVLAFVGIRRNRPENPLPWYLVGIGISLFMLADAYFLVSTVVWHLDRPFPSIADIFFLRSYPALATGLLLMVRRRNSGRDRASLIDASIIAVLCGLVLWVDHRPDRRPCRCSTPGEGVGRRVPAARRRAPV